MAIGDKVRKYQASKQAAEAVADDSTAPVAGEQAVTLTFDQLKDLLGQHTNTNGLTPDVLESIMAKTAEMSAEAMRRSLKPENTHHPEISAFSYPEGERARPRPSLPFELLWKGFPIHKELSVSAWWELEQLRELTPGTFTCLRTDGTPMTVTVTATYAADNKTVASLSVDFDCTRETRPLIPSPYVLAYQMTHPDLDPQESFTEAMGRLLQIKLQDRKAKEVAAVA